MAIIINHDPFAATFTQILPFLYVASSPANYARPTIYPNPTGPLKILDPHNQEIGELYVVQERRATDFEACERVGWDWPRLIMRE